MAERALARIDLPAITRNCRRLAAALRGAQLGVVVKADGYGHGAAEAAAPVRDAARLIADSGHNRLPVVEHGRLVGVVTRVDVLEALARE